MIAYFEWLYPATKDMIKSIGVKKGTPVTQISIYKDMDDHDSNKRPFMSALMFYMDKSICIYSNETKKVISKVKVNGNTFDYLLEAETKAADMYTQNCSVMDFSVMGFLERTHIFITKKEK